MKRSCCEWGRLFMPFSKQMMVFLSIVTLLLLSIIGPFTQVVQASETIDYDPLEDIMVTFELLTIRSLEKYDNHKQTREFIDLFSAPDFYVKVSINDKQFTSSIWKNTRYINDADWRVSANVPDDEEWVEITIELWDWNLGRDQKCDISGHNGETQDHKDVTLYYNLKSGHWTGDDYLDDVQINADPSGYGRLNGCDDGSIYIHDFDAELWFDVYQTDHDGDGIPYWTETEMFNTNPNVDDRGRDDDADGIPIEWEWKWGYELLYNWHEDEYIHQWQYDPFVWDDHENLDPDMDGLNNVEEYLMADQRADPFRKDLFVELDQMEAGPNGEPASIFPEESKRMLRTAYNRYNVVYHLDDGSWESNSGAEMIPFDEECDYYDLINIYENYFLHNDDDNWRRGIFHYGLVVYGSWSAAGMAFRPDAYVIASRGHEKKSKTFFLDRNTVYASAYMHECGHTLGIHHGNTPGCDDREGMYPWEMNFWKWRPYRSVMNYGYMYKMLDYSDGSGGKNDFDDWDRLDFTYFQRHGW